MKYILITGVTGAVGSNAADFFMNAGYGVIGVGRKKAGDIEAVSSGCSEYFSLPSFNDEHCADLFRKLQDKKYSIEAAIFFNGGFSMDTLQNFDVSGFEKLLNQNYLSTVFMCKYALPYFEKQEYGSFIFTSAAVTDIPERFPNVFSYTASKTLINHLAQSINVGYAAKNIRVALVKPGTIRTASNLNAMPDADQRQWVSIDTICESIKEFIEKKKIAFEEIRL